MLVIEDGSIVENADSYITVANARLFLSSIGLFLAVSDADAEVQLRQAFYYLEGLSFLGSPSNVGQLTKFPRSGLYRAGELLPSNEIPVEVRRAQAYYAGAIQSGINLIESSTVEAQKARTKVGQLEVSYYKDSVSGAKSMPLADKLLKPFLSMVKSQTFVERA